jgi:hypothetical protein
MTQEQSIWRSPKGNDYPLVDSTNGIFATVTPEDVACGVEGDPCQCVIAQSFMRAAGSPEVIIGRTIAYVVLRIDGELKAVRLNVPAKTRRAIDGFDATGDMPADALELRAIRGSDKLESKRLQDKRMRERWSEHGHEPKRAVVDLSHRNAGNLATTRVRRGNGS